MLGEKRMKISILRAQNSSSYYLICVRGLRCIFHRCVHGRSSLRDKDSICFYMDKYFSCRFQYQVQRYDKSNASTSFGDLKSKLFLGLLFSSILIFRDYCRKDEAQGAEGEV